MENKNFKKECVSNFLNFIGLQLVNMETPEYEFDEFEVQAKNEKFPEQTYVFDVDPYGNINDYIPFQYVAVLKKIITKGEQEYKCSKYIPFDVLVQPRDLDFLQKSIKDLLENEDNKLNEVLEKMSEMLKGKEFVVKEENGPEADLFFDVNLQEGQRVKVIESFGGALQFDFTGFKNNIRSEFIHYKKKTLKEVVSEIEFILDFLVSLNQGKLENETLNVSSVLEFLSSENCYPELNVSNFKEESEGELKVISGVLFTDSQDSFNSVSADIYVNWDTKEISVVSVHLMKKTVQLFKNTEDVIQHLKLISSMSKGKKRTKA